MTTYQCETDHVSVVVHLHAGTQLGCVLPAVREEDQLPVVLRCVDRVRNPGMPLRISLPGANLPEERTCEDLRTSCDRCSVDTER